MKMENKALTELECLKHSIKAQDIPSQQAWYKQQIGLYYGKVKDLAKRIKQKQREFNSRSWQNSKLSFEAMQTSGKENREAMKKWHDDYKELTTIYCSIGSLQVSFYLALRILNELKRENKKLYHREGDFYEC